MDSCIPFHCYLLKRIYQYHDYTSTIILYHKYEMINRMFAFKTSNIKLIIVVTNETKSKRAVLLL